MESRDRKALRQIQASPLTARVVAAAAISHPDPVPMLVAALLKIQVLVQQEVRAPMTMQQATSLREAIGELCKEAIEATT